METSSEIKSAIANMKYYATEIDRLVKLQLDKDCSNEKYINTAELPTGIRYNSLGIINSSLGWIDTYLVCIENMVKKAEEQDEKLKIKVEDDNETEDQSIPF